MLGLFSGYISVAWLLVWGTGRMDLVGLGTFPGKYNTARESGKMEMHPQKLSSFTVGFNFRK